MLRSVQYNDITWIDIQDPKPKDLKYLRENFHFHELVLGELIPPGHRPKVEQHDDYLFMILYYPLLDKKKHETYSRELDILVTKSHIITSHYETIVPLKGLFDQINTYKKAKEEYMSESTGHLLFYIIRSVLESALTKLEHIKTEVDNIEDEIFSGREREMVFEISKAKRDVIDFRRIFAPQKSVIESLASEGTNFFDKELQPHFEDLQGTFGIIWNEIHDHMETINALAETNESLLSAKINEIIRVLTIFSAIFLPLTLIASIWGMNTEGLPFAEVKGSFWMVSALMFVSFSVMVVYFKKKRWL